VPVQSIERKLAAIFTADIAGYCGGSGFFGQRDKSDADRSRKSVKVGANGNQHSAAFKE
jgi:hypothetical protein